MNKHNLNHSEMPTVAQKLTEPCALHFNLGNDVYL